MRIRTMAAVFCSEICRLYLQENGTPGSDLGGQDRIKDQS